MNAADNEDIPTHYDDASLSDDEARARLIAAFAGSRWDARPDDETDDDEEDE